MLKRLKSLAMSFILFLAAVMPAVATEHVMKFVDSSGVVLRLHSTACEVEAAKDALGLYGVPLEVLLRAMRATVDYRGQRHEGCYVLTPDGAVSFTIVPTIGPSPVVIPMDMFREEHKI